jgi:hypothetical protein
MVKKGEDKNKENSWLRIIFLLLFVILLFAIAGIFLEKGVFFTDSGPDITRTEDPGMFWFGVIALMIIGIYTLILSIKKIYLKIRKKKL